MLTQYASSSAGDSDDSLGLQQYLKSLYTQSGQPNLRTLSDLAFQVSFNPRSDLQEKEEDHEMKEPGATEERKEEADKKCSPSLSEAADALTRSF